MSAAESGKTASAVSESKGGAVTARTGGELVGEHGKTSIADAVVAKVAGMATREVPGVYAMGSGLSRAVGAVRERLPRAGGPSITRGVMVEVGERQTAIDLDMIVEYGVSIPDLANGVRRNVISAVEKICGLEVTEVNITVGDVHLPDEEAEPAEPRVQ
ncbi:Asp23/Gls24 family envelope stress response protein [Actinoallomurus rhizosphaericola]|uniref:Asp23/Gls24 family envelope stress response protein n=1 Tax=Actinoallomurus rhizosphaericola TaxID=2952536 RepID=UPI0020931D8C|nr:Asp23/Gls24 family envelope stress response protein [Actinoallomurus rhizosphaericola]MCO5995448.1 Asp23/Gls24 family envelope stress response protein [Actinoallomurus rhizosphaericola]